MKKFLFVLLLFSATVSAQQALLHSPTGKLELTVSLDQAGILRYQLLQDGATVIAPSVLGVQFKDAEASFDRGMVWQAADTTVWSEMWEPVLGEESTIYNDYHLLTVKLSQPATGGQIMEVQFRLYDAGLGFRYYWPAQDKLNHFVIADERTQFSFNENPTAWWIPGDYDTNEYFYVKSTLGEVKASRSKAFTEIGTRHTWSEMGVQTPLQLKTAAGRYINIHEAALTNYPVMQLEITDGGYSAKAHLVPNIFGDKAYLQAPCQSPWRAINVGSKATDILASRMILNLNEPSKIKDPSFIKTTKYVGIWWEMHAGISTWDYAGTQDGSYDINNRKPSGKHGATTERTKVYIDFAAKHGLDAVLIEGWNTGWEDWFGKWKEDVFDFVTPYPDFDVPGLSAYAKSKGVKLIMHHETSGSVTNYERWMDTAYRFMKKYGYPAVKTGYVGKIIPRGEYHDGQWMTRHFNRVAEKTAAYGLMVNMHESHRPTGLNRTWPNWIASEAARGNEFNAWSSGNPPEHETILPFTRLMGGAMDYTPGIFEIKMSTYKPGATEQVHTTLAKQLALYVTMYSPLQMAADLPENYNKHLDAFQFIKDVALDWDETYYLEAEPGDYLTIARKAKGINEWFVGAITDENSRTATIDLSFLPAGKTYTLMLYRDAVDAHWEKNPMAYTIEKTQVNSGDKITVALAAGGGAAISIK